MFFKLDCSNSWSYLSIRPKLQDQDQDQTCKTKTTTAAYKTKTKTSFCWSETGRVIRPRSQTTSLVNIALSCTIFELFDVE